MALLNVNETAEVLFLKPSKDPGYPWLVLCYDPTMKDPWVVWFTDDDGDTITGGYYATLEGARADFDSRPVGTPATSK